MSSSASNGKGPFRSVVIFGGAGFIGCNWAHWLLENSAAKVHIFDNLSRAGVRKNLDSLQQAAGDSGRLQITIGDVRNQQLVESVVRHATEIYHFAAQVAVTTSVSDPRFDFEVNVGGTINVLEAARKFGKRPFILFTSTNKVYGELSPARVVSESKRYRYEDSAGISESQPLDFHSPYGCSKGAADQYVHDYSRIYGLPTVVFRMSCIAGPRQFGTEDQGWVAHFIYSAMSGRPVTIFGDGRQVRDVLCVNDLMLAFNAARITPAAHGEVFNVGGGTKNATSLLELAEAVEHVTGNRLQYSFDAARPGDQLIYITDHAKLTSLTGWQPRINVQQTLELIHAWRKRFPAAEMREPAELSSATTLGATATEAA